MKTTKPKPKPKPLPKLRKNAKPWEILAAVCKVIADEPRRYDQSRWLVRVTDGSDLIPKGYFPECGTVACVAGWTCIINRRVPENNMVVEDKAQKILGLDYKEREELFDVNAAGQDRRTRNETSPRVHARRGIAHIKRFVKKKWGKKL